MNKKAKFFTLIISALVLIFVVASCKKKDEEQKTYPAPSWYSPVPGENGTLPTSVLPGDMQDSVTAYINIHEGTNPPEVYGQFVSRPHILLYSTYEEDSIGSQYNDRYIAFFRNGDFVDFYGKQWDDDMDDYYEEVYRKLYVVGEGENFTCYYLTEGYPDGMYAKQSTVFSGNWDESLGGLGNFQVAVILLETSGNPNLAPERSFRVLGDGDGLAQDTAWMDSKRAPVVDMMSSSEDAFRMFRIK